MSLTCDCRVQGIVWTVVGSHGRRRVAPLALITGSEVFIVFNSMIGFGEQLDSII